MTPRDPDPYGDGYGRSAPLAVHVHRKIRFASDVGVVLPRWDEALFGERGHGAAALPWDSRFRPEAEFLARWDQILSVTTRDWVNLDLAGVRDRKLLFVVEYLTDDHIRRTWPNELLSINGGVGGYEKDPLFLNARW